MAILRLLLVCLFGVISMLYSTGFPDEGRTYVSRGDLKFAEEGIYIRNPNNTWARISGISCDEKGYYISQKKCSHAYTTCPACRYTNVPDGKPCPRCGYPLSDDLPWKQ